VKSRVLDGCNTCIRTPFITDCISTWVWRLHKRNNAQALRLFVPTRMSDHGVSPLRKNELPNNTFIKVTARRPPLRDLAFYLELEPRYVSCESTTNNQVSMWYRPHFPRLWCNTPIIRLFFFTKHGINSNAHKYVHTVTPMNVHTHTVPLWELPRNWVQELIWRILILTNSQQTPRC
jgi:hypothetical protein